MPGQTRSTRSSGACRGAVLRRWSRTLEGADRAKALTSFVDAAVLLGRVTFDDHPYGELLKNDNAIYRASWGEYLRARLQVALGTGRAALTQDVPDLDRVVAHLVDEFARLEPMTRKGLVHGDYFAGNVFIDDDLNICGVGDFGYSTLVGDPRMDLARDCGLLGCAHRSHPASSNSRRLCLFDRIAPESPWAGVRSNCPDLSSLLFVLLFGLRR